MWQYFKMKWQKVNQWDRENHGTSTYMLIKHQAMVWDTVDDPTLLHLYLTDENTALNTQEMLWATVEIWSRNLTDYDKAIYLEEPRNSSRRSQDSRSVWCYLAFNILVASAMHFMCTPIPSPRISNGMDWSFLRHINLRYFHTVT